MIFPHDHFKNNLELYEFYKVHVQVYMHVFDRWYLYHTLPQNMAAEKVEAAGGN